MFAVKGLCAGYGRVGVLWDITMTVRARQIVALIGPNGSGKTTLLRALSGMIPPRSGSVTFRGSELVGRSIEEIVMVGVAHVPEGRRLFPGLTVRDNLRLGAWRVAGERAGWRAARASRPAREPELDRVLELFPQLGQRLSQVVGTMSGGEQQMCAIARGLMSQPDLIMIDELSLGLAPVIVDEIMTRLPDIAAGGTSVLLVEQDVDAALNTAEYGYVLETGRIALAGWTGELLADARVQQAYLGIG
ncbi:MAG TPA: ABC transporter ATP-binding protein [Mycobacteriales bacterium]|nr:ABC transporter ATP-binding protein [Mycobacteriales bacterium]